MRVYDAASGGRAQKVASLLTDAGFVVLPVEAAPPSFTKTELLYRRSTAREMAVVSSYVKVYASVETFRYAKDSGGDVAVVVGPDYRGIL